MLNSNLLKFEYTINETTYPSFYLASEGNYNISEIARYRNVSESTIVYHLIPYIYNGYLEPFVSYSIRNKICEYLKNNPNCNRIKLVFDYFNGEISYNDIRQCYYYYNRIEKALYEVIDEEEQLYEQYKDSYQFTSMLERKKSIGPLYDPDDYDGKYVDYDPYQNEQNNSKWREDSWDAMTDGIYGDYSGNDDYDFLG